MVPLGSRLLLTAMTRRKLMGSGPVVKLHGPERNWNVSFPGCLPDTGGLVISVVGNRVPPSENFR